MNTYRKSTLVVGFALLGVVATVGTVLLAGGGVEELAFSFGTGMAASVVVIGVYGLSSSRGLPHSHSVAAAGVSLGVLYIVALMYRLLTEFPA